MSDRFPPTLRANSFFVSIGAAIRLVVSLISIPLLVRFLGVDRYGVWVVLNSVIAIAALTELGLTTALTNFLAAEYAQQDWARINRTLTTSFVLVTGLGAITSVGLWLAHPLIGRGLFLVEANEMEALQGFGVISWLMVLRFWQQWAMAAEAAFQRFDVQATIETASSIAMQIGVLVCAMVGYNLWVLAAWSVLATGASLVFHGLALKRLFNQGYLRPSLSGQTAGTLVRFGLTQWVSNLGASLFGYADRILVNLFLGPEAAGLYSAGTSVAIQINTLSAIPLRVIPSAISAAKGLSQFPRIREIFIHATRLNGLLVLITAAPLLYWAPEVSNILVGAENAAVTAEILKVLGFSYGIYSLSVASHFTAIGVGHPILNARWGVIGALFSLFLLAILTPRAGLLGAAWGNLGYALTLIVNYQIVKIISLKVFTYQKLFLPSVIMIFIWWLFAESGIFLLLPLWGRIITFGLLGCISAFYINGLTFILDFFQLSAEVYKKILS